MCSYEPYFWIDLHETSNATWYVLLCQALYTADFSGIALDIIQYSDEAVCFQRTSDLFIGLHCKAYVAIMYILVS